MLKLPYGISWLAERNAKDDWFEQQSARRSRLFLMFIRTLVDPPKRGVDFKAPCQKFSRSLRKDSTSRLGLGFTLSIRIIAMCSLSS